MIASVFVGISVDGFLARTGGELDFLPAEPEPHGFTEFYQSIDTVVIGRRTFEFVLSVSDWFYGKKRVIVLSSQGIDMSSSHGKRVEHMAGDPAEIVARLAASGSQALYVDGGVTIQRFLRAGVIQRLILTRVPVLIGQGIPLFGSLPRDIPLRHVATRSYDSGLVQTEYQVLAAS